MAIELCIAFDSVAADDEQAAVRHESRSMRLTGICHGGRRQPLRSGGVEDLYRRQVNRVEACTTCHNHLAVRHYGSGIAGTLGD